MSTRAPAVAGSFYPADPVELAATVDELLAAAPRVATSPKALVVPHAGLRVLGPDRRDRLRDAAARDGTTSRVSSCSAPRTASRSTDARCHVPMCSARRSATYRSTSRRAPRLAGVPGVVVDDRPHASEHSLEVQLPFLQRVLPAFTLVPIVVGRSDGRHSCTV